MGKMHEGFECVDDIDDLMRMLADGESHDFRLILNGGFFSCKTLTLLSDRKKLKIEVENHIDGSVQKVTREQLMDASKTNIGEGIKKGSFWKEPEDAAM